MTQKLLPSSDESFWNGPWGPILLNAICLVGFLALFFNQSQSVEIIDWPDFTIEFLSGLTSYVLFLAVCFMSFGPNIRRLLLVGLSSIEFGRLADALDEILLFDDSGFSILGDGLTLFGEVMVATAAIRYLIISNTRANTDPLTQLFNRRYHEQALEKLIHFGSSEPHRFAVIALDLDNFKQVNDTHGHKVGDAALQHAAQVLKTCSRQHDVISRVGGEEFEVLVPVLDTNQAMIIAERIRNSFEQTPPPGLTRMTASIGVAVFNPGDSIEGLRERADKAVYQSKRDGKNRITLAD